MEVKLKDINPLYGTTVINRIDSISNKVSKIERSIKLYSWKHKRRKYRFY